MSSVDPRFGLFVMGSVRTAKCQFLIDTGSTDTLISSAIYHQIPKERRPVLETEGVRVKQIDGSPLVVLGSAVLEIKIGRTIQLVKVTFTEMKYPGILGMDFLVPTGGSLDFQLKELRLHGE